MGRREVLRHRAHSARLALGSGSAPASFVLRVALRGSSCRPTSRMGKLRHGVGMRLRNDWSLSQSSLSTRNEPRCHFCAEVQRVCTWFISALAFSSVFSFAQGAWLSCCTGPCNYVARRLLPTGGWGAEGGRGGFQVCFLLFTSCVTSEKLLCFSGWRAQSHLLLAEPPAGSSTLSPLPVSLSLVLHQPAWLWRAAATTPQ